MFTIALIDEDTPDIFRELIDTEVSTADEIAPAVLAVMDATAAYEQERRENAQHAAKTTRPTSTFIVGPQRRREGANRKAFETAAAYLRSLGWYVLTPFEVDEQRESRPVSEVGLDFGVALRQDMDALTTVASLGLIEGWQDSASAVVAISIAQFLSLPIYEIDPSQGEVNKIEVTQALAVVDAR